MIAMLWTQTVPGLLMLGRLPQNLPGDRGHHRNKYPNSNQYTRNNRPTDKHTRNNRPMDKHTRNSRPMDKHSRGSPRLGLTLGIYSSNHTYSNHHSLFMDHSQSIGSNRRLMANRQLTGNSKTSETGQHPSQNQSS